MCASPFAEADNTLDSNFGLKNTIFLRSGGVRGGDVEKLQVEADIFLAVYL